MSGNYVALFVYEGSIMTLKIGDTASRKKIFTDKDIQMFAEICGDTNPVHLDDDFAAQSQFGKRVVYGVLTGSIISAVLGNDLPGQGTIYLNQTMSFKAPVFIGEENYP